MVRRTRVDWDDETYVTAYELAKSGMSNRKIAATIGVCYTTLLKWIARKPALKRALIQARTTSEGTSNNFIEYVYNQLPDGLKRLWDKINSVESEGNSLARIESLFEKHGGLRARQHLFFHALVTYNFNQSEACRRVGIERALLQKWMLDPDFCALIEEFNWHKANFFESKLVRLVEKGDGPATIFANKTFNKKRGYNEKVEIDVKRTVQHEHQITIEDLDKLPLDVREKLLGAIRLKKDPQMIEHKPQSDIPDIIDAEIVDKEEVS